MSTETLIGTGINVFTSEENAVGVIRFLDSPDEVLEFIDGPDVENTVVISRGGTTTFIEMICPARSEKPLEAFELWLGKAAGQSACDFTFHMGVTRYDEEAEQDFRDFRWLFCAQNAP